MTGQTDPGAAVMDKLRWVVKQPDLWFALFVVATVVGLIFPMPSWLLDLALTLSITVSVLILLTVLFIQKPLEFSAFPTVLLITTMIRLALNLASTRLVLGEGQAGAGAAGHIIEAFGTLVMRGDVVIGMIVFMIITLVNFVVITKGSGRIAEVSARFSLDAMPGKQMAIDADLSAGLIDEKEAKRRRKEIEEESAFFGAMDGAGKFVRGDAVAGLIITAINLIGGIIIGTVRHGVSVGEAVQTYSTLTIGDGLVSQIPALLVSTAAGILVSRSGVGGRADKALINQVAGSPKVLGLCSFLLVTIALLPGMPMLPFLTFAAGTGYLAWLAAHRAPEAEEAEPTAEAAKPAEQQDPVSAALAVDRLRLELGYGIIDLATGAEAHKLTDRIKNLRQQIAAEFGFVIPSVRVIDNIHLDPNTYVLRVREVEVGRGELRTGMLLVMDPAGEPIKLPGEDTREPTFGAPAKWVDAAWRDEALARRYTVVEPIAVLSTHMAEIVKDSMTDLLGYDETQKLVDELARDNKKLVEDTVPSQVSIGVLQRVLQNLLTERVSVRDLQTIVEATSEGLTASKDIAKVTEYVRTRLARQISEANTTPGGHIPIVTLSPEWEQSFAEAAADPTGQFSMSPGQLQAFIASVRDVFDRQAQAGEIPVILTGPTSRGYIKSIMERIRPHTVVLSQNEIHPRARVRTVGQI